MMPFRPFVCIRFCGRAGYVQVIPFLRIVAPCRQVGYGVFAMGMGTLWR